MHVILLKYAIGLRHYGWLVLFFFIQSCALFKPVPRRPSANGSSPFMEQVNILLDGNHAKEGGSSLNRQNKIARELTRADYVSELQGIEYLPPLMFRYAVLMDVEVEKLANRKLFEYINQWWGVPYRIGGNTMTGIDCSGFVKGLTESAYGLELPRTSRQQADFCREISKEELQEGDLVFFNTSGGISHVGLYLSNNKFVHASTSMGVVISDLNEPYWAKRYVKSGRILEAQ